MTYSITKSLAFSAAHRLTGLPPEHKCARMHGHNYQVDLVLQGPLNEVGFVRDFGEVATFKQYLDENFDHRTLNDVMAPNPTAENVAEWLFDVAVDSFPELVAVKVYETPSSSAEYRP
jgi:6-pyruvoyltetrahydropterin/6-carboxytetrahydropterin synthase